MQPASDEEALDVTMIAQALAEVETEAEAAAGVKTCVITPIECEQGRARSTDVDRLNLPVRELCVQNYDYTTALT